MVTHAGIIGLGLIGGSFAKALRANKLVDTITAYDKNTEGLQESKDAKVIDHIASDSYGEDFTQCDLIVIAAPLASYIDIAHDIRDHIPENAHIIELGSVKQKPVEELTRHLYSSQISRLMPCHPIAGSEYSGFEASDAELFTGKKIMLCPTVHTSGEIEAATLELWRNIGAKPEHLQLGKHDLIYAYVSHLVQLLAYAFVLAYPNSIDEIRSKAPKVLRLAASQPHLWIDIFMANKTYLFTAIRAFKNDLEHKADIATVLEKHCAKYEKYAGPGYTDFLSSRGVLHVEKVAPMLAVIDKFAKFMYENNRLGLHDMITQARQAYTTQEE